MSMLRIPLLIVPLLALAAAAHAAKPGAFGTRDQLRECLAGDDAMKARLHEMELATAAHNQRVEANDAEGARLADMKAAVDRSKKESIAAFNQAVQDHNAHIQEVNQEAADAEAKTRQYWTDKTDLEDKCQLSWRPADVEAVNKERKKAAAS